MWPIDVQQHVDQVMPAGVEAEQLDVQHVRKPGQRKPVRRLGGRERPLHAGRRHALAHVRIGGNVIGIVKIDEIEASDRQIRKENRDERPV